MEAAHRPVWLRKKINFKHMHETEGKLKGLKIHTVCHQARCPNISECFGRGTATFMILGDRCTRNCAFCNVKKGAPLKPDPGEPGRLLEAVMKLGLKYVVITSVTRDDLPDGGAGLFAECVERIKKYDEEIKTEVLVPDFKGDNKAVDIVLKSRPDIFAHNVETVPSLYHIRKGADYARSLGVIRSAKKSGVKIKSGIMLGMGEKEYEVISVLRDLREAGCDFLSIGQYLRPSENNIPVAAYIHPEKFDYYRQISLAMGFLHTESGPYVRSSYFAERYLEDRLKFELV